jgi:rubredoxin
MPHWMCTTCGYYLQAAAPPPRCPSCLRICAFNDITCRRPDCGGEGNIDALLVGNTLSILKAAPGPPTESALAAAESLHHIDLLRGLSAEEREKLKSLGTQESYEPGTVIFPESAIAENFYLLEEGQVSIESRLSRGLRFPIMTVSPGQAFGWSALVVPHQYTATALALTRVKTIAIPKEAMLNMMRANPALGLAIMEKVASIVASRVRSLELALAGLLQKDR